MALVFAIVFIAGGYFYLMRTQGKTEDDNAIKVKENKTTVATFTDMGLPLGEDIVNCEFRAISSFVYQNKEEAWSEENRKVHYSISEDKEPTLVTFSGLSTKNPKIKGNLGEGPLAKIKEDDETYVLLEQNTSGDIFTYTIFKEEKIATWYKAYKMIGTPFGMLSMGYCY